MNLRFLSEATKELAEAVRPNYVRAQMGQQDAVGADIAHTAANMIESAIDSCLSKTTTSSNMMQMWQENGVFHAKVFIRWQRMKDGRCSIRFGLDWPIAYVHEGMVGEVRKAIIRFYQEEGWGIEINDDFTLLTHEGPPSHEV